MLEWEDLDLVSPIPILSHGTSDADFATYSCFQVSCE